METSQNKPNRQEYKHLRDSISSQDRFSKSLAIKDNFLALLESDFKGANIFLCYYPFGSEVDLRNLYDSLLSLKKDLYFPVSNVATSQLHFKQITNLDKDFKKGAYGIMEPVAALKELDISNQSPHQPIVVITPGLIFDKSRNRVGYGKGFYDRFFADNPRVIKVGTCFDVQLIEQLSVDVHDVAMDYIVTNNCVLKGDRL